MNELMLFSALSAQQTEAALLRGNAVTERFGLTLTPEQCGRLLARRAEALRETERIELGEGILPKLAVALCDSPCVGPENWEEALGGLTELFYHFKGACGEHLGDDELLAALVRLYNGWAGGCAAPRARSSRKTSRIRKRNRGMTCTSWATACRDRGAIFCRTLRCATRTGNPAM